MVGMISDNVTDEVEAGNRDTDIIKSRRTTDQNDITNGISSSQIILVCIDQTFQDD